MRIEIAEWSAADLAAYARIPIAFEVTRVYEVVAGDMSSGRFRLEEQPVARPWIKDYDAAVGEGPLTWPARFDVSRWGFLVALEGAVSSRRLGAAAVAYDTPGLHMLEGRRDLAVLWDIRVAPEARRCGVGTALFRSAGAWAAARGCRQLKVETQNINVVACEFYAGQGCALRAADPHAYPGLPGEVQLLWYKDLT
jgi:GNAT superfamily N-acetyltransferase